MQMACRSAKKGRADAIACGNRNAGASEFEAFTLKTEAFAIEAFYTKQSNGKSLHAVFVVRSLAKDRSSSRAPTEQIQSRQYKDYHKCKISSQAKDGGTRRHPL